MIDLDAYFARLGYTGSRTPTLETLGALHALHPADIPFENLDPLLGRPVKLDLASLEEKLVASRRGGYCFEHNTLFKAVLEALGFRVTGLGARVVWGGAPGQPLGPRSHMLLLVDMPGGAIIADVGFGGYVLDAPLRLEVGNEQTTQGGVFRFVEEAGFYTLQVRLAAGWQSLYRFGLEPQLGADYEVANWYMAMHPASRMRNLLMVERVTPEVRITLADLGLTRRFAGGQSEETQIRSADEFARVLTDEFAIDPPADVGAIFARLVGK